MKYYLRPNNEAPTELTIWMALRQGLGVPQCNIVTRMPLATIALLCKQITITSEPAVHPNCSWRHLSGNRLSFLPH